MSDSETDKPKTALYASKENEVVLRPHVYDGIQEYDQKLPNWWLFTFYIMVVWFIAFWITYYQFDFGSSDGAQIDAAMGKVNEKKEAELEALLVTLDDKSFVTTWATNEVAVTNGLDTFTTHCVICHGTDLSATKPVAGMDTPMALPGLPLDDGEWKFGGNPMAIFKLIKDGSPPESTGHNGAKMEVWGNKLTAKTIAELTSFIISKNEAEFTKFAQ